MTQYQTIACPIEVPIDCSETFPSGGGTIYSAGFFVQSILTDRYASYRIVSVSLESLSSIEFILKNVVILIY